MFSCENGVDTAENEPRSWLTNVKPARRRYYRARDSFRACCESADPQTPQWCRRSEAHCLRDGEGAKPSRRHRQNTNSCGRFLSCVDADVRN